MAYSQYRVLAIDEIDNLTWMRDAIWWAGHACDATSDRKKVIKTFSEEAPFIHAVVAGVEVPTTQEIRLIEEIRRIDEHMPLVLVNNNGHDHRDLASWANRCAATRLLHRTASFTALQCALSQVLAARYP